MLIGNNSNRAAVDLYNCFIGITFVELIGLSVDCMQNQGLAEIKKIALTDE